ncbi:ArsR family transcriptional regulator [Microbacterium sp. 2C]|uniref:ArsR family transcriptional regulator n=1 Tax=Microbacterium paulum TaxID=2707006 RepID=UPI0018C24A0E|nr:ArsR family transcriptional regulator [Microbacterium paulum]MBG0718747.1 ArsR family transcriptional regulator [Microbacterium paulum]
MTTESVAADPAETRADITRLSARGYAQIRHIFVQLPDEDKPRASVVAKMLTERKHRALLLYLLLLTAWPWLHDRREPLEADIWVRALTASVGPTWSASTLSRAWSDLAEMGLVTKKREGRLLRVTPRREDGGADYEFPGGRADRWNAYFALPDEFWNEALFAQLSLPALVMMLVIAKETNYKREVWLGYEAVGDWYGIKPKSAQKGLTELVDRGIVHRRIERKKAPLAPGGETVRMWYSLTGTYGHEARSALQERARKATRKRVKAQTVKFAAANAQTGES